MATITKRLNGIDLHRPDLGWNLDSATTLRAGVTNRRSPLELPRVHGSRSAGRAPVYGETTVSLSWWVEGGTQTALEDAYAGLVGLLMQPGLVYQHEADGLVTEAAAELVSISEPGEFLVGTHVTLTALLALPGVFLRGTTYVTTNLLSPGTHDLRNWSGSAPIPDPVIRFTGPMDVLGGAQMEVYDTAYGEGVEWMGPAITSSQYLYVDPARFRAWIATNTGAWDQPSGTTDVTRFLSYPPQGRLQLHPRTVMPAPGTTDPVIREVRVTTTGRPCVIRAKGSWL